MPDDEIVEVVTLPLGKVKVLTGKLGRVVLELDDLGMMTTTTPPFDNVVAVVDFAMLLLPDCMETETLPFGKVLVLSLFVVSGVLELWGTMTLIV